MIILASIKQSYNSFCVLFLMAKPQVKHMRLQRVLVANLNDMRKRIP